MGLRQIPEPRFADQENPAARFVVDGIAKHTPSRSETVSERLEYSSV